MASLNLEKEIKAEYRNSDTWFDQIGNVLSALLWGFSTWLSVSTVLLGLAITALIVSGEINASYSSGELVYGFKKMASIVYVTGAFGVVAFGVPKKLRNLFYEMASNRVERKEAILSQARVVESVLIRHGLITEDAAKTAQQQRESE